MLRRARKRQVRIILQGCFTIRLVSFIGLPFFSMSFFKRFFSFHAIVESEGGSEEAFREDSAVIFRDFGFFDSSSASGSWMPFLSSFSMLLVLLLLLLLLLLLMLSLEMLLFSAFSFFSASSIFC